MAFLYDENTNKIALEPGDTGGFTVGIEWPRVDVTNVALVLGVCTNKGEDVLRKHWLFNEEGIVHVWFCNHDTRDIDSGTYKWQMRFVTDPEYDEDGNVIAQDCSDKVISYFNGDKLPVFRLTKKGAKV